MAQGGTRAERKRHTRALILEAARNTVARSGFESLALREVARSAGIVPTAFYRHFESLEELAVELGGDAVNHFRDVLVELEQAGDAPPWETWPDVLVDASLRAPTTWAVMVRGLVEVEHPAHEQAGDSVAEARRRLGIVLSRRQECADRSASDLDVTADLLVAEVIRVLFSAAGGSVTQARRDSAGRIRVICGG